MSAFHIRPETAADRPAGDRLIEAAFGPGHLAKAAERLRETSSGPAIALCAEGASGAIAGVVRLWPVRIGERPALFLGPIAVDASARGEGLGRTLIEAGCEAARLAGWSLILLVGDQAWFGPLGFSAKGAARVVMPGPVDQARVLARPLAPGADEGLAGEVRAEA